MHQRIGLTVGLIGQFKRIQIYFNSIAGFNGGFQDFGCFQRHNKPAVHGITVENSGIRFGHYDFDARFLQSERGMFARRTAAKIGTANDDAVFRFVITIGNERDPAVRQSGPFTGHTGQGKLSVFFGFLRIAQAVHQMFRRNDLIGVDIIA